MKISDKLISEYDDYYLNQKVLEKRQLTARQTVNHIRSILSHRTCDSILDVGAGDGSVLQELDKSRLTNHLHAVEISDSGYGCIINKKLNSLRSVEKFDGYNIKSKDKTYDLAIAIHVLEHVEHERMFLQEICRVGKIAYIEVPLELTLSVKRSIKISGRYGHINYYTPSTFENLLTTSGLQVIDLQVFANSMEYEVYVSGRFLGGLKNRLRRILLWIMPDYAPFMMTYMAGALCSNN